VPGAEEDDVARIVVTDGRAGQEPAEAQAA
jgi:hypothetical protein